jgi:hypothetical protein
LVIAYADEKSLRELIAAPSILGPIRIPCRGAKSARTLTSAIALSNQMREKELG